MKQLFRLVLVLFSLFIFAACSMQDTIQVEKASDAVNSAITMESKELIKVAAKDNETDIDETEATVENKYEEQEETASTDSSQDSEDEIEANKTAEKQSASESSHSNQTAAESDKQQDNTSNPAVNSNKSAAKDKSSSSNNESSDSSNQPKQGSKPKEKEKTPTAAPKSTAFVSVESPSDLNGPNLASTAVEITDGETAFAATLRVLKSKGISIDYIGSGATAYVKSIGGLGEFDAGPLSGWNIYVEGIMIPRSADAYEVFDGYKIHWKYTKNYLEN
ncbi:DUF4430 domain-containing protein [Ralstonia pickettii]|nr:DUF4430 domain-containing protein [Ralstonia pickettii]